MLKANGGAGGGSGTVNAGTAGQIAVYSSSGTAVSGETLATQTSMTLVSTVAAPIAGTGQMAGLAATIVCGASGVIHVTASGNINQSATANGNGIMLIMAYGTGTPPANGAAVTGTTFGNALTYKQSTSSVTATNVNVIFSHTAIITNLTPGTTYWIDEQQVVIGFQDMNISDVAVACLSPAL